MKKAISYFLLVSFVPLASQAQQCTILPFSAASPNYWALSPTVANAALTEPAGMAAINAAGAVWNGTDAAGRLLGWNGLVGVSDCPSFSHPLDKKFQVTALSFDSAHIWCPVAAKYQTNVIEQGGYVKKGFLSITMVRFLIARTVARSLSSSISILLIV